MCTAKLKSKRGVYELCSVCVNYVGDIDTDTDTDFIVKATGPFTRGECVCVCVCDGGGGGGLYNSVSVFVVA